MIRSRSVVAGGLAAISFMAAPAAAQEVTARRVSAPIPAPAPAAPIGQSDRAIPARAGTDRSPQVAGSPSANASGSAGAAASPDGSGDDLTTRTQRVESARQALQELDAELGLMLAPIEVDIKADIRRESDGPPIIRRESAPIPPTDGQVVDAPTQASALAPAPTRAPDVMRTEATVTRQSGAAPVASGQPARPDLADEIPPPVLPPSARRPAATGRPVPATIPSARRQP